jgi:hypothetical protein
MDWSKLFYNKTSDENGASFTSPLSFILFIIVTIYCVFF